MLIITMGLGDWSAGNWSSWLSEELLLVVLYYPRAYFTLFVYEMYWWAMTHFKFDLKKTDR